MDMNNTHRVSRKVASTLATALLSFCLSANAADSPLDRVVAVVNKDIILDSDVQQVARRLQASGNKEKNQNMLLKQALDSLVSEKLQLQAAKRVGINPNEASIDRAVSSVAARNKLSLEQFKQALKEQGIDFNGFRKTIASQLIINNLKQRRVSQNSGISAQAINDLITAESRQINAKRSYHLQELMIPRPASVTVTKFHQSQRMAKQLRDLALRSPDFMKTSLANSVATDLGWKKADSLSFAYLRELTKLEPGQISNVISGANGLHILKLIEQRGGINLKSQQVRVRHILIAKNQTDAKEKADRLRQQLTQGADFGRLAKAKSDDLGSARNSGDLGWSDSKQYVSEFAQASESLPLKTISPVIKTKFGYHILEVLDRREINANRRALETKARQLILTQKQKQDYDTWVQGLRTSAYIEYKKP